MIITLHRKGHLEETYPFHLTESKPGPRFTYRPSLGIQLNRVFLIAPCATRQSPCRGSLCWPVGANSGSNQKESRPMHMTNNATAIIFESISKAGAISPATLNGLPGMSSLEIAEATGKRHDHVLRGIKKMLKEVTPLLGRATQYVETSYQDSQNKTQPLIVLDKELTFTMLTGYSATLRLLVNRRWLELEGSGFERVSVQATVVHLVERERCDWTALKGYKKAPKPPLSDAEKEIQKWKRQAKAYEDANPMR